MRLAACEFLHAACVFLIGKTSQQREEYKSHHLYSKLFPTILDLSIDADATVRVLFENLLAQVKRPLKMKRYFSIFFNLDSPLVFSPVILFERFDWPGNNFGDGGWSPG